LSDENVGILQEIVVVGWPHLKLQQSNAVFETRNIDNYGRTVLIWTALGTCLA